MIEGSAEQSKLDGGIMGEERNVSGGSWGLGRGWDGKGRRSDGRERVPLSAAPTYQRPRSEMSVALEQAGGRSARGSRSATAFCPCYFRSALALR